MSHASLHRTSSAYFLHFLQEMSSMLLTGKRFWNRSLHSWSLPWQPTNFPPGALCPPQTMHHQLTWSSAPLLSCLLPTTHHTRKLLQPACSRSNRRPDQVDLLAAHLQAARQGCYPCPAEYRSALAALYAPGRLLLPPKHYHAWPCRVCLKVCAILSKRSYLSDQGLPMHATFAVVLPYNSSSSSSNTQVAALVHVSAEGGCACLVSCPSV